MQAERSQSSSSNAKENERKDGNEISSPFATKLLMRKHETQKGMEVISLDGNESHFSFPKSKTMTHEKEENPDAIVKPPSSPVGLKLLLRKNAMQAERLQSSSSDAKENERKDGNEISSPFATKLLMRKHETQKDMEILDLGNNVVNNNEHILSPHGNKLLKQKIQFQDAYNLPYSCNEGSNEAKAKYSNEFLSSSKTTNHDLPSRNRDYESSPHGASLLKAKHDNENRRQVESSSGDELINHSRLKTSKTQEIKLQGRLSKPIKIKEDTEQALTQGFSSPFGQALLKRKHEIYKDRLREQENFENNKINWEGCPKGAEIIKKTKIPHRLARICFKKKCASEYFE